MFSFFEKKNIVSDIEWLGVDIHSHLLPALDDGCKDNTESLDFIKQLVDLGFYELNCTPHIFSDLYPNTPDTILPALHTVDQLVSNAGISVKIGAAAEYMTDSAFKPVSGLLTLPGNHILIEMSYLAETPNIDQLVFDLHIAGYKVILAHPERYNFYHATTERYHRLKELGCFFQLNLLSTLGYYGSAVKHASEWLLKNDLYDVAGTDLHHYKHMKVLSNAVRDGSLFKKIGHYDFKNKELNS
jgi:protein-tyrosine phosphatase